MKPEIGMVVTPSTHDAWVQDNPCTPQSVVRDATTGTRIIIVGPDDVASGYYRGIRDGIPCRIDIKHWTTA